MKSIKNYIFTILSLLFILSSQQKVNSQDRSLIDSLTQVLETSKKDTNKVNTFLELASKYERQNSDTSILYSEQAHKLAQKLSYNKGIYNSIIYKGLAYYYSRSYNNAIECFTTALSFASEIDNKGYILKCYSNIGLVYLAERAYDKAEEHYRIALNKSIEIDSKSDIAKCYQNIGIINYYKTQYDSAVYYYSKAIIVGEGINNKDVMMNNYNNIGIVHERRGTFDLAIEHYKKALKIANEQNNKAGIAKSYISIGIIHSNQGSYKKANDYYFKALYIFQELNNNYKVASCLNNIGVVYRKMEAYDNAIEYYKKALVIFKEFNKKNAIAAAYNNIGIIYSIKGEYSEALKYLEESLKIRKELNQKKDIASSYLNMGTVYAEQELLYEALEYYLKHLETMKELDNPFRLAKAYQGICSINIDIANSLSTNHEQKLDYLNNAIRVGEKAIIYARQVEAMFIESEVASDLRIAYENLGNYKKALEYADIYIETQDSLFSAEKTKAIQEMETKYQTEKKNIEIQELRIKDIENQNIKRLFLLIIISLGVISVILFFFFRQKVKTNKILDKKNYQLNKLNETQSRLMSIISHDLKAPLSAFFSITSSLKSKIDKMDSKSIDDYFNRMLNSALAVKLQLENLLVWSITQTTDINVHKNSYNLSILVQKVIVILEEFSNEKSLALENKIDENIEINTDGRLLSIVLNNITTNAIKFSDNNSSVEILATKTEGNLLISVKDYGCGMSKENLANLFAGQNNMKHANKGTGLGLIVCKDIMEKLGGKIWAESEERKGSTFYIEIGV